MKKHEFETEYAAMMRGVSLSEEAKARMEQQVKQKMMQSTKPAPRWIRPTALVAVCALLAAGGVFAARRIREGNTPADTQPPMVGQTTTSDVQIPNPLVSVEGIRALAASVPFVLRVPAALPEGYTVGDCTMIAGTLAQVKYTFGDKVICYRMAEGSDDISGDYSQYAEDTTREEDGISYRMRGENEKVSLLTWTAGGFSYALSFDDPMSADTALAAAASLAEAK